MEGPEPLFTPNVFARRYSIAATLKVQIPMLSFSCFPAFLIEMMHRILLLFAFATSCCSLLHAEPVIPPQKETDSRLPPKVGSWGIREATVKDASLPRVLLIGDSITASYLDGVRKALDGKVNIDAWITPTTQADKSLPKILEAICHEHSYAIIHFNLGLHGWQPGRIPEGQYEPLTRQLVENLRKSAPQAKLIWATITPVTVKGKPEELNPEIQPTIVQHNALALKVMKEEGVEIDDLSTLMLAHLNFAAGDMFHWKNEGRELLVKAVSEAIGKALPK
jgi:hypothetical protein